jgi:hypothetical protein
MASRLASTLTPAVAEATEAVGAGVAVAADVGTGGDVLGDGRGGMHPLTTRIAAAPRLRTVWTARRLT